jgi:hypothetical protein
MIQYKARYKTNSDKEFQLLTTHLQETGMYAELFAKEIDLPKSVLFGKTGRGFILREQRDYSCRLYIISKARTNVSNRGRNGFFFQAA